MAANIRARQWTGRARARLEDWQNGGRCGHEPGSMEPEGPRLENMPIEWREADARANCGQHNTTNKVISGKVSRVYSNLEYKII
jgi:hypothetical protein